MPTYEYACTACGNEFERFESITAKPNKVCPKCNAESGERKISGGGGFIFKGTGFYVTDYKKSGGGKSTSPPAENTGGAAAEKTSGDAKPAAASGGSCGSGCGCHPAPAPAATPAKSGSSSDK